MRVGERRKAMPKGINLFMPRPTITLIRASDTNVVALEFPTWYSAYLRAMQSGTVILTNLYVTTATASI